MQLGRQRRPSSTVSSPARAPSGKNALTAAGSRINRGEADKLRRLVQPWQSRAFAYYDILGEIKFAAQFYARGLSPLRLYAAEIDDAGEIVETENQDAKDALARIQDPGGGRTGLLSAYGRLMFLTGEAYLFVTTDQDSGLEQWEMLSTDELRPDGVGGYLRYKAPSLGAEEYREPADDDWEPIGDKEAVAYRLWQRHPRYSELADSTMQGVLDIAEELVLLTQAVRSRVRSRLAGSGILFMDAAFFPKPLEPVGDEDPNEDPFMNDLIEAMTAPITDEGSASAVVPLLARVPVPEGLSVRDLVYHLQIVDPMQLYPETGLRTECIDRLAIGLDMPPEILKGLQDSNHWTGWAIQEETWKAHLMPKAQQLCDDLTAAYFRPSLQAAGIADFARYVIAYDAAAVINHPDRTKDAKDLYEKRAIGKTALRDAAGFTDDDAPTQQELDEMIGVAVRDGSLATTGVPSARDSTTGASGTGPPEPAQDIGAETTETGPPEEPPAETVIGSSNGRVEARVARILGASDLALLRAREAAGSRIRSLAKRDHECEALIDGIRPGQVAAVLGRDRVKELRAPTEPELVAGARVIVVAAFTEWGIDAAVAEKIADVVERHAARTLYDERSALPPSFANYVAGLATEA